MPGRASTAEGCQQLPDHQLLETGRIPPSNVAPNSVEIPRPTNDTKVLHQLCRASYAFGPPHNGVVLSFFKKSLFNSSGCSLTSCRSRSPAETMCPSIIPSGAYFIAPSHCDHRSNAYPPALRFLLFIFLTWQASCICRRCDGSEQ